MPSLYEAGWRQGSILVASLPFDAVVMDTAGQIMRRTAEHPCWVVAAQECELDLTATDDARPTIELRAVHSENPPDDWGIRSSRFRLTESEYVVSDDPRQSVSAAVLTAVLAAGGERRNSTDVRSRAFAIWLGLRYDRPALPPELGPLARRISDEVCRRPGRIVAARVRDVLMQFEETTDPIRYSLFAVLENAADEGPVREWLAGITSRIPQELGIADVLEAATADRISFRLIEESYAADVSRLTWRQGDPDPTDAE